jgi:hypothetical protein
VPRAEIEGRRQTRAVVEFLTQHVPEFKGAYLIETAAQIGIRETRRILGDYVLTLDDLKAGRKFDDGVATVSFGVDIHNPVDRSQGGAPLTGVYDIPYRCLVPCDVEGLLVAGRCGGTGRPTGHRSAGTGCRRAAQCAAGPGRGAGRDRTARSRVEHGPEPQAQAGRGVGGAGRGVGTSDQVG